MAQLIATVAGAQTCAVPASELAAPGYIGGTLRPAEHGGPPVAYTRALLEVIGEHYVASSGPMTLGEYAVGRDSIASAAAFTVVTFTITDRGTVTALKLVTSSLSPSFDHNVVAAVRGLADTAAGALLPPWPRHVGHHTSYYLEVEMRHDADTTHDKGDTVGAAQLRWAATTIPEWRGAVQAGSVPGPVRLQYPEGARRSGVGDSVLVRFVIGTDGRIMPGTTYLLHASYRVFVDAIAHGMSSMRYVPTTIAGCPVASIADEPFMFKIQY